MKKKKMIRAISMMLALLTASPAFVQTAKAIQVAEEVRCVYLEERELAEDVLTSGNFYISSKETTFAENSGNKYLLKVGRGGENLPATSVRVNLMDTTADYGEDYKVRVHNESVKTEIVSKSSILEQMIEEGSSGAEYNATDVLANGGVEASLEEMRAAYTAALEEIENSEELTKEEQEAAINELFAAYNDALDALGLLTEEETAEETTTAQDTEASAVTSDTTTPAGLKAQLYGYEDNSMPMDGSGVTVMEDALELTDMLEELYSYSANAGMTLDFAEGETEKYLEIIPIDNWKSDGTRIFTLYLLPAADNSFVDSDAAIQFVIEDDEDPVAAKIGFSDVTYSAEDGFVRVTVVREDALNETVQVNLSTKDITAENGVYYSKVDTTLVFPFGITERTLNIPVYTEGLEEMVEFKLFLSDPIGCEITNDTACGQLYPDTGSYSLKVTGLAEEESASDSSVTLMASSRASDTNKMLQDRLEAVYYGDALSTKDYFNPGVDDNHGEVYPTSEGYMKLDVNTSFWTDSNGSGTSVYLATVPKETAVTPYATGAVDDGIAYDKYPTGGTPNSKDKYYDLVTPAIFYRGYEITWKLDSAKPSWPKVQILNVTDTLYYDDYKKENGHVVGTPFWQIRQYRNTVPNSFFNSKGLTFYERSNAYFGKWNYMFTELLYESEVERHESRVKNFYSTYPISYGLVFNVQQLHTSSRDPELEIQKVRPIMRPFQIELREVTPLEFIDANGDLRPSTEIPRLQHANSVQLSGDSDNDKTIVAYKDEKITVSLDNFNPYAYIKSVKLVRHGEEKKQISVTYSVAGGSLAYNYAVLADNLEPGTRSYTFSLDEDLVRRISGYDASDNYIHDVISFESIGNDASSDGLKGMFDIEVELGYVTTKLEAVQRDTATVGISQVNYHWENGQLVGHMGDYIFVYHSPKPEYADAVATNAIQVDTVKYIAGIPESNSYDVRHDPGTNYIRFFNDGYSSLTFTASPVPRENQIVIKIHKGHIKYLDMNVGIFANAGEPEDRGDGYLYYTVVSKEKLVVGQYYMLDVYPLDSGTRAFWYSSALEKEFAQNELYYCADDTAAENVLELDVWSAEYKLPTYYLSFNANFLYEESTFDGTKGKSWIPAADVCITASSSAYGISNEFGELLMNPCLVYSDEGFIRIRIEANGVVEYRDLPLYSYVRESNAINVPYTDAEGNTSTVKAYRVDLGTIEVSKYEIDSPRITSIQANTPGAVEGQILIDNDLKTDFTVKVCNDGSTYYDSDDVQRIENVTGVNILILDHFSNEVVYTIPLKKTGMNNGTSEWKATTILAKDAEDRLYKGSDKIYAQVITDRVKGNGMAMDIDGNMVESEALMQTIYVPIDSGLFLAESGLSMDSAHEATLPFDEEALLREFVELPFIGSFNSLFTFSFMSLTMTQLPENGFRISLGYFSRTDAMIELYSCADDGVMYPSWPLTAGLKKIMETDIGSTLHESSYLASKSYMFRPTVALYIDFGITAIYDEETNEVNMGGLCIIGGGLMFGVISNVHLVQYGLVGPIPAYMGIDLNISLYVLLGMNRQKTFGEMPSDLFAEKEGVVDFNAVLQSLLYLTGYVGVGLAGKLGIRGGMEFSISAVWNPTLQNRYPEIDDKLGLLINYNLKVWVDALLGSIPLTITGDNLRFGYYNDPLVMSDAALKEYMDEVEKEAGLAQMGNASNSNTTYSLRNDANTGSSSNADFIVKERTEVSEWLPYGDMSAMSTYAPIKTTVLQEGGFDSADPQLLVLDDNTVLLAYLTDDPDRSDNDRTALMLAVYSETDGWSDPVMVQNDSTADFDPDLCDAGENVLLTWVSREPSDKTAAEDVLYLADQEIFSVIIPKKDITCANFNAGTFQVDQNSIMKLSNDKYFGECYDASPVGIYDEISGDMVVYYLKSAVDSDAEYIDAVNATRNGCVIVYMLYDGEEKRWLTDKYFDTEYSDAETRDFMVENMKGQRFLPRVEGFCENGINDPVIIDFDAISYNGLGVYTFTVDKDNNLDTSEDRELFIQFYNFESHKTYKVIRLTENNICEARPQLARSCDNTYLFWFSNNTDVYYINVSELVKNGINDDGTLKYIKGFQNDSTAADETLTLTDSTDGKPVLDYGIVYFTASFDDDKAPAMSSFKPFVDENNCLYITWVQEVKDEDGNVSQEIFVSSHPDYSDTTQAIAWADPVAISELGMFQDQVAFAAYGDGKLLTVSNVFGMDLLGEEIGITDYFLTAVNYTTVGSMAVVDASLKTNFQGKEPMLNVAMEIRNTGMKYSRGYDLEAVLVINDEEIGIVYEENYLDTIELDPGEKTAADIRILPTHSVISSFGTALPATIKDGDEVAVRFYVKESGFDEESVYTSESVTILPQYDLSNVIISQQGDEYVISGTITNKGMVDGSGDVVLVELEDLYKVSDADDKVYLSLPIGKLAKGQSTQMNASFRIPAEHFAYGYVNLLITPVREGEEENIRLGTSVEMIVSPASPVITVNGGTDTICLNGKDSLQLEAEYSGSKLRKGGIAQYTVADTGVAYVEDGKLIPVANGTTTLTVTIKPYGGLKKITVVITDMEPLQPNEKEEEKESSRPFIPTLYEVTVDCGEGGKVDTSDRFLIAYGSSRAIKITADEGFKVADVLVNGKSVGAVEKYTIKGASQNYTVFVVFEEIEG